jgi:hypothetical protein
VLVEGERLGVAPLGALEMPVGTREIVAWHPELGEKRMTLDVKQDQVTEITLAFPAASAAPPPVPSLPPLSAPAEPRRP